MKRDIITIDETLCDGCGLCVPNCPEGAIQIIDGKARLVSDMFCDGLGACLGNCPQGAITIERREAEEYDERKVMENVVGQGSEVIRAHLEHLQEHGEHMYYRQGIEYLYERGIEVPEHRGAPQKEAVSAGGASPVSTSHAQQPSPPAFGGCPGKRSFNFGGKAAPAAESLAGEVPSALSHWPLQLHLIHPLAEHYRGRDLLLSADCVAYALGNFHQGFLAGKSLAIACPKLDSGQEVYVEKLTALIDQARINTLTVMIMEVPCCGGLLQIARTAVMQASRKVPLKVVVVGVEGEIIQEDWV